MYMSFMYAHTHTYIYNTGIYIEIFPCATENRGKCYPQHDLEVII